MNTNLSKMITLFEEKSRNYTGVDFGKAPAGMKKILIAGFDPFVLIQPFLLIFRFLSHFLK
jgi:hypothetical protein